MLNVKGSLMWLLPVVALSGCATPVEAPTPAKDPVEVPPPKLAPAPADVMVRQEPNFRERLLQFFQAKQPSSSSAKPTEPTR